MKQFKAVSVADEAMRAAVQEAIAHHRSTGEHCQAVAFAVLLWDSRHV